MNTSPLIQPKKLYLGSASPRRRELLRAMGLDFEVLPSHTDETYPDHLKGHEITDYLALKKATSLKTRLTEEALLITADTVVWFEDMVMEKPANLKEAKDILLALSGKWHEVITSVCFTREKEQRLEYAVTSVKFSQLDEAVINRYFRTGNPLDKAGAYGIQEWIGLVGVEAIQGSYTNVVGLPTELVYKTLRDMVLP